MSSKRTARCGSIASAAHGPHAAVSGRRGDPARHLGGRLGCAARRRTPIASTMCSCPRRSAPHARPTLRHQRGPLYAFTMQCLYATGVAAVAFGIARAMLSEFIALASRKAPRTCPARRQRGRAGRRGACRGPARLGSRLSDRDALHDLRACRRCGADRGSRSRPCAVAAPTRSRAQPRWQTRLQGRGSTASSRAPVRAPLPATCTRPQQIQARGAHFEQVGQILLGVPPRNFFETRRDH